MPMILPQVEATAVPLQQFEAPRSENVAAEQGVQQGQAMMKAGSAVMEIAQDYQDRIDTAYTQDLDNDNAAFIESVLSGPENPYLGTLGENATAGRAGAVKAIQDRIRANEDRLHNNVQREMYTKAATHRLQQAIAQIDGHALQQSKVAEVSKYNDGAKIAFQGMASNVKGWDQAGSIFSQRRDEGIGKLRMSAQRQGLPPESTEMLIKDALTPYHDGIIDTMLEQDNPQGARSYYDAMKEKGDIDVHMAGKLKIDDRIQNGLAYVGGKKLGDEIFTSYSDSIDVNNPPPVGKMLTDIERSGTSEKEKKYAEARVHELDSRYKATKTQAQEATSNKIAGMMAHGNDRGEYSRVIKAIESSTDIDRVAKSNLKHHADIYYHISEDRALAKQQATMQQGLQNLGRFLAFQNDYASGSLGQLSPEQVRGKYAATFGAFTDDAMRFVQNANDTATGVKLPMDQLKSELRIMKLNPAFKEIGTIPNPDSTDETDKANMALLQARVIGRIAASGKAGPGKQISVQQALAEELRPVVTSKGRIWDTTGPAYKLGTTSADDVKNWGDDAKLTFIKNEYYRQKGFYPDPATQAKLLKALNK